MRAAVPSTELEDRPFLVTDPRAPRPLRRPRLLVLDLDGTCLAEGGVLPGSIQAAVRAAIAGGMPTTIATGRFYRSTVPWAHEMGITLPVICSQGAAVRGIATDDDPIVDGMPTGPLLFHEPLRPAPSRTVLTLARERSWLLIADTSLQLVAEHPPEQWVPPATPSSPRRYPLTHVADLRATLDDEVDRLVTVHHDVDAATACETELRALLAGQTTVTRSSGRYVEVTALGATKGQALRRLAGHLGIDVEDTVAIGDGRNDIDMLETAGFSVAIQGAVPELLAQADAVCSPPEDGGVADVLSALGLR